ncbi:MAG TPA: SDR family oxidoreductase [Caulobacterales bacterium]|nr:SDR family oxidoreductase [Caulobacterales bacterium]
MAYANYPSLNDLPIVVTGGASGIGMAMVRAFAAQRAKVGFVDFDVERGQALAAELGPHVRFQACDLRDIGALKSAFAALEREQGPALVLVNNAARDDRHSLAEVTPDYYDERIASNLRHMFFAIQAVAPGMIAAKKGSIINLGSDSWWRSIGNLVVYTQAKAAVHGLTRGLARELGQHLIRINTLVPGWTMTERQKTLWVTPEGIESQLRDQCLPVLIEPEYIANMALFLAADDSAMCTAQTFFVEGGAV